jgi:hypothetical protein
MVDIDRSYALPNFFCRWSQCRDGQRLFSERKDGFRAEEEAGRELARALLGGWYAVLCMQGMITEVTKQPVIERFNGCKQFFRIGFSGKFTHSTGSCQTKGCFPGGTVMLAIKKTTMTEAIAPKQQLLF